MKWISRRLSQAHLLDLNGFGFRCCALLAALLIASYAVPARAAEMVTNLGEASASGFWVSDTMFEAQGFTTDDTSSFLESVTINMPGLRDSSGNFTLSIFTDNGDAPGAMVPNGLLSGPGNPSVGLNTYTATGDISLAPNTTYWVVAQVTSGNGEYSWSVTSSTSETGSWSILDHNAYSSNSAPWEYEGGVLLMSVSAREAEPEAAQVPTLSMWGMLFLAILIMGAALQLIRRRRALAA